MTYPLYMTLNCIRSSGMEVKGEPEWINGVMQFDVYSQHRIVSITVFGTISPDGQPKMRIEGVVRQNVYGNAKALREYANELDDAADALKWLESTDFTMVAAP